jgi:isoamylase
VLAPTGKEQAPIFIVLNAAPEEIAFKLPKMSDYRTWRQVLNTAEITQSPADFASGADNKAPSRSVLAFAGVA